MESVSDITVWLAVAAAIVITGILVFLGRRSSGDLARFADMATRLADAQAALEDLRAGRVVGRTVLVG